MAIMNMVHLLKRMSLEDVRENEEVIERTPIEGLYWIRNYFLRTSSHSRIVLQNPGQGNFTVVYHGSDFSDSPHNGYELYGIHTGQVDVLTFMATDGRKMSGHFVDCRKDSPTLHKDFSLEFGGDPDRALVIQRGIAHIFDNLIGMVTLNQIRMYMDWKNPDFDPNIDVLNVPRGTAPEHFPVVQTNRFYGPRWLCRLAVKSQRIQLRWGIGGHHPFKFKVGERKYILTPVAGVGALAPYDYRSDITAAQAAS